MTSLPTPFTSNAEGGKGISRRLRGVLTLGLEALLFLAADLVQRTLVVAVIWTRPRSRERVLTAWARFVNEMILGLIRVVGGAKVRIVAKIPFEPGTLVLMNHQSLMDILVALRCVEGGYPIIVTRGRYARGYPLISHMVRLYGHPTVRPGEHAATQLEFLKQATRAATRPVLLYPEGSRSRDGGIRPFKKAGLKAILSTRRWSVHVLVGDGMFGAAGVGDFVNNVSRTTIRAESAGPFYFDHLKDDADGFIASMEGLMIRKLAEMRGSKAGA
jgi:1-acyl-sn-glycerol-3-phosphate acyltransferase